MKSNAMSEVRELNLHTASTPLDESSLERPHHPAH